VKSGELLHLMFKQDSLRFFDPETTLAIGD